MRLDGHCHDHNWFIFYLSTNESRFHVQVAQMARMDGGRASLRWANLDLIAVVSKIDRFFYNHVCGINRYILYINYIYINKYNFL